MKLNQILPGLIGILLALCASPVLAQNVILDGTLNPDGRRVVPGNRELVIEQADGVTAGRNLFHSLERLNLASDQTIFFSINTSTQNILVRVTGGVPSLIDGRIFAGTLANGQATTTSANLFLINPSGITLGANARLALGGSFVATTLNAIQFPNGQFVASRQVDRANLLTLQGDPSGFLASQSPPGEITIRTRGGLTVAANQSLLLVGGNVKFENSTLRISFEQSGRRVEIGGLIDNGTVGLAKQETFWTLTYPQDVMKAEVSLNKSQVQVLTGTGASLAVNARNLTLENASELIVGVFGGPTFPDAKAGNLQLNVTDQVSVLSGSIVSNEVPSNALGNSTAGDVVINTQRLIVQNSLVRSDSFATGNAGNLTVKASQWVDLSGEYPRSPANPNDLKGGPGGLFSQVNRNGRGNGGNVLIETPLLRLRDGAKVQTATFGTGPAGTITIIANDVEVLETSQPNYYPTAINAGVTRTLQPNLDALGLPTGNAGALTITADRVKVNGGSITVANFGVGEGGNLEITARDRIQVDNGGDISTTTRSGQGGNLFLTANNLILLRHGGQLNATAGTPESSGNGGNIQLNAPFVIAVPVENSDIIANAFKGRGGNITITTEQLLGLQFRDKLTPDSDITASSDIGLNGTFTLNTPDLDPNRGLVQLPTTPTDPSNRIDQSCASSSSVTRSRFTVTGRGGLPSQPDESLSPSDTLPRLATLPTASVHPVTQTGSIGSTVLTVPIVEAQAALRLPNGKIRFVAQGEHSVPDAFGQAVVMCQSRRPE